MHPASSYALKHRQRIRSRLVQKEQNSGPLVGFLGMVVVGVVIAAFVANADPKTNLAVSTASFGPVENQSAPVSGNWQDSVEFVFNPQPRLNKSQMEIFELVQTIPNHPEKFGLDNFGLYSLNFSRDKQEAFQALVMSESLYQHLDPETGELLRSSKGCVSITQGCNNVCPVAMWEEKTTNVWCGAKTFTWFWDQLGVDENPMMLYYAYAGYKGIFTSEDTDGDGIEDSWVKDPATGLPYIPEDLKWQIELALSYLVVY